MMDDNNDDGQNKIPNGQNKEEKSKNLILPFERKKATVGRFPILRYFTGGVGSKKKKVCKTFFVFGRI